MNTSIIFLTKTLHNETREFAIKIATETDFKVHIIVDDNNWEYKYNSQFNSSQFIKIFQVKDSECIENGFYNSNIGDNVTHIKKNPIAYDKFMYLYSILLSANPYSKENYWVFEDDVFIPSIEVLVNLNNKYKEYDLVTANNDKKNDNVFDWHWPHITNKIGPPYYSSMVSAAMFSSKLLKLVNEYVKNNKTLFYIEAMFNTIAMQNNLNVIAPLELKSIVWMGHWGLDEFLLLPNNIFHPLKEIELHQTFRNDIEFHKNIDYKPINNLPKFITDLM